MNKLRNCDVGISQAEKCFDIYCLGWLESQPAVKKFWTIRTKGNGHSFHGKWHTASEPQFPCRDHFYLLECPYKRLHIVISIFLSWLIPIWERFLCRIWSFKGLASFDLLFVHSAITFCVSRKWQYYYNTIEQRTGRWQRYLEPNLLYRAACLQTFFLLCQPP